jgi:hypothetical protein
MKTKTKSPFFTLRTDYSSSGGDQYHFLYVTVHMGEKGWDRETINFKWQAHYDPHYKTLWDYTFYGGRFEFESRWLMDFDAKAKLVRKILTKAEEGNGSVEKPRCLLSALRTLGIPQYVYDRRESKEVPVEEVKDVEYKSWRDDWHKYENNGYGCRVACLARDEEEARRLLTIQYAEQLKDGGGFCSKSSTETAMRAWMVAGCPVIDVEKDRPKFELADEVMAKIDEAMKPENRTDYEPPKPVEPDPAFAESEVVNA